MDNTDHLKTRGILGNAKTGNMSSLIPSNPQKGQRHLALPHDSGL